MDPDDHPDNTIQKKYELTENAVDAIKRNEKVIFLLENPQDVELLLYLIERRSQNLKIIVSSPAAAWELEKREIIHSNLNEYFNIDDERDIGYKNFAKLNDLCREIDEVFFKYNPVIAQYHFSISKNFFPYLKILYDGIVFRVNVLKTIIDREKPGCIITVKNAESFFTDTGGPLGYPYSRDDSIYSLLLDLEGWSCNSVQIVRCRGNTNTGNPIVLGIKNAFLNSFLSRNITLYSFGRITDILGTRKSLALLPLLITNRLKNGKTLVFSSYSVEWQRQIPSLLENGFQLLFINESEKINSTVKIPDVGELKKPALKKNDTEHDIDFSQIFFNKIYPVLKRVASDFIVYSSTAEKIIRKNHPVACIGNVDLYLGKFFVIVAKQHAIPKITWQHGTTGYVNTPIFIHEELINSDYYFVWGRGVSDMYAQMSKDVAFNKECKIIPMGSATLNTITEQQKNTTGNFQTPPKILYATMSYYHNSLNFGFDHRFDDIEMWNAQKAIITFLADCPSEVVVKLHPGEKEDYQIREFIESKNAKNITIIKTEKKFSELALESDLVILDCPSTILLEALAAKKTVFALFEFLIINPYAAQLLKKRAFVTNNRHDLIIQIKKYLNNEPMDQNPDISNTEFLECYGVSHSDAFISEKILETINIKDH